VGNTGFTLLRLNTAHDVSDLRAAFQKYGAPFSVLDIASDDARAVYERDLLLLRPDLHVVWRGNRPPENPQELAVIATGHSPGI